MASAINNTQTIYLGSFLRSLVELLEVKWLRNHITFSADEDKTVRISACLKKWPYENGLRFPANDVYAWLEPDDSYGFSNAG